MISQRLTEAQRGGAGEVYSQVTRSVERELFGRAIELAHGNQAKAARWLGVSRLTMREKLRAFGIHPEVENEAD
jgi:DNA-binding protein Fis